MRAFGVGIPALALPRSGSTGVISGCRTPGGRCRDIAISNCVVSSNASGIKIGTESAGAFEDIVVQNCTVYDTRCEGLAVLTVDGARIERVSFSNIALRNIKGDAILVRLPRDHLATSVYHGPPSGCLPFLAL